jgi:uncharacterized protein YcbX
MDESRVHSLAFTPLKGARQSAPDSLELALTGPVGDHALAVVDLEGGRVLKTVENPGLLACAARWDGACLTIDIGDVCLADVPVATGEHRTLDYWGRPTEVEVVGGPWAAALSTHLGREVALARATRASGFVYGDPLTIVTTGALRRLGPVDPRRFRANIVIDTGDDELEPEWMSRQLQVGTARLEVTGRVIRCAVIDFDHGEAPREGHGDGDGDGSRLLKTIATASPDVTFGVYARVVAAGRITRGDLVRSVEPIATAPAPSR